MDIGVFIRQSILQKYKIANGKVSLPDQHQQPSASIDDIRLNERLYSYFCLKAGLLISDDHHSPS